MNDGLPLLRTIRHPRHPGISAAVGDAFTEAAEVCLGRHHEPSETPFSIECCGRRSGRSLTWRRPSEVAVAAWRNRDDATRDGAYIVCLAAVERELGLVALSRAETRTGADYYVGLPDRTDLEKAYRLEVSGLDDGSASKVRQRLRDKAEQASRGASPLPAYASVVGFRERLILINSVGEAPDAE